jgi:membrane protein DedA with SNARE-associated domain
MNDYKNRKFTLPEIMGVSAACIMFAAVGMIMGGTAAGNNGVFYTGAVLFSLGAVVAVYLLIKYGRKKEDDF